MANIHLVSGDVLCGFLDWSLCKFKFLLYTIVINCKSSSLVTNVNTRFLWAIVTVGPIKLVPDTEALVKGLLAPVQHRRI